MTIHHIRAAAADPNQIFGDDNDNLLTGTYGYDQIWALGGNDTIRGLGGDDEIWGGDGDDVIQGGAGNDALRGNAGADLVEGGGGNDTVSGVLDGDTLSGGAGDDLIQYLTEPVLLDLGAGTARGLDTPTATDHLAGFENARGSDGTDSLIGDAGANILDGDDGDDSLSGAAGNDSLQGGYGNDLLAGGAGDDTLNGGVDHDLADYSAAAGPVIVDFAAGTGTSADGSEGIDQFIDIEGAVGGTGDDSLYGGDGADDLRGRQGSDLLVGRDGDDILDGGLGEDTLDGSLGNDTARYTSHLAAMTIDLANQAAYSTGGLPLDDVLISIENAIGGRGDDELVGSGIGQMLDGGKGNDTVRGAGGDDTLAGGHGEDHLLGGAGNDKLLGATILIPVSGEDDPNGDAFFAALVDDGQDVLNGGGGSDTVVVPSADYYSHYYPAFWGQVHADVNLAAATLRVDFENATTDRLVSIENVITGSGNDTVHGDAGANRLEVGDGINIVHAGNGDDTVIGGTYTSDEIFGYPWQDVIHGDRGNDLLIGNGAIFVDQTDGYRPSGQDHLVGGAGDDTLVGGTHRTVMEGGEGADHFQSSNEVFVYYDFESGETRATEAPQILDFDATEGDKLVISIAENPNGATPTFVGQIAHLDTLGDFEFGYTVDGDDVVARFVTQNDDEGTTDNLDIRFADYDGGLLAEDVLFV